MKLAVGVLVEGHVTGVRGRRDVQGARVELLSEGQRRTATTDAVGAYRFGNVPAGKTHLHVTHPEYASADLDVVIEATGRADRAFDVDAIDLDEPGAVRAASSRATDSPSPGANRTRRDRDVRARGCGELRRRIEERRDVRSRSSGSGKMALEAYASGAGRGRSKVVEVTAGNTVEDVVITLTRGGEDQDLEASGGVAITLGSRDAGGILVSQVARDSEAERAGLIAGDLIETIDGARPDSAADARRRLAGPDGSDVVLGVRHDGARAALRIRRERVRR